MKLRSLRSLVGGEDRDSWYDDHSGRDKGSPNVGGNIAGGGGGGG